VWTLRYDELLQAGAKQPQLMRAMHAAMSQQIGRECDNLLSLGTLPADARVANFIADWAESLAARDLRTDQIRLHMSRAEIGNYLGMTLETVSRALRRLADSGVIRFDEKGRRDISIPCLQALRDAIRCAVDGADAASSPAPSRSQALAA
jgi:CRP/FNR family transcriptional regulator, anaerobic regulatory protein